MSKSPPSIPSPILSPLRRSRTRLKRFIALGALIILGIVSCTSSLRGPRWSPRGWLSGFSEECRHWIPTEAGTDGGCPAAKKLREVQAFLRDPVYEYDNSVFERVRQVEACALGLVECPPEPLVVSLWSQLPAAESTSEYLEQSAQLEWRAGMVDAVHQFNFVFVDQHNRTRALHLVRALTSSIHQVWMSEHAAIECLQNPRCILPYDYSEPDDPAHTPNVRDVRDEERGVIPMWRLMITSWLGCRPSGAQPPGANLTRDWGITAADHGNEQWSLHPIGKWHIISPYMYPQHAWIPFTHQRACDPSAFTASRRPAPSPSKGEEVAERTVVILGDVADLEGEYGSQIRWGEVHNLLLERGFNVTFQAPATHRSTPHEEHVYAVETSPEMYPDLVGSADAVLGVGSPRLSTLPYIALCRGTPVVLPFFRNIEGQITDWARYDPTPFQHGEFYVDEREPYAYKYPINSPERMAYELGKALANGMDPYQPRQFSALGLYERMEAVLNFDYVSEYDRQRIGKEKKPPVLNPELRAHCWKAGWCRAGMDE